MSGDDIGDYFNQNDFKIKKLFWLNDYSCVIEFDSESQALDAFQKFTGCSFMTSDESDVEKFDWKPSLPFIIQDESQELFLRVSEKDVY
jgi:hypothetical protein